MTLRRNSIQRQGRSAFWGQTHYLRKDGLYVKSKPEFRRGKAEFKGERVFNSEEAVYREKKIFRDVKRR